MKMLYENHMACRNDGLNLVGCLADATNKVTLSTIQFEHVFYYANRKYHSN